MKYTDINFDPPAGVRAAFKRGLALHAEGKSGDGLVPATVAWARRLAAGDAVTPEKARKGNAWHARHAVDERPGWGTPGSETPGYVAHMLWGGAPGRAWFAKLVRQMDAADDAQESTMKTTHDQTLPFLRACEAVINLQPGETIDAYSSALGDAAQIVALQALNDAAIEAGYDPEMEDMGMEDPDFRAYTDDAGADYIVLRASRSHPWMSMCLRMSYTRDNAGLFTFGAPEIVVPRRVYDVHPEPAKALGEFVGANLPAVEAVEKPAMKARKNLPAAAYAAPFFAGPDGGYSPGGTFLRSKSALPFHVNTAKDVDSTETVDVPRLRAALSRFEQTDFSRFGDAAGAVKAKAKARLDKAAKAVLPASAAAMAAGEAVLAKMPGAPVKADVEALTIAYEAFERSTLAADAEASFLAMQAVAAASVKAGAPIKASESAAVQRDADAILLRAKTAFVGEPPAAIVRLRRLAGMMQLGRVHDVAAGRV